MRSSARYLQTLHTLAQHHPSKQGTSGTSSSELSISFILTFGSQFYTFTTKMLFLCNEGESSSSVHKKEWCAVVCLFFVFENSGMIFSTIYATFLFILQKYYCFHQQIFIMKARWNWSHQNLLKKQFRKGFVCTESKFLAELDISNFIP